MPPVTPDAPETPAEAAKPADAAAEAAKPADAAAPDDAALLDAALKRTELLWVGPDAQSVRAAWHVWTDGSIYLMCGGGEQAAPVQPEGTAVVVARSKDKGTRLISFAADVARVEPG